MFSAAPTPQVTASILKALEIIKKEPQIRTKLWENTNYLRKRLKEEGFDIGKSVSPIFPIMIRDNKKVYESAKMLQEKGIFTIGIVYPAVRTKEARLRAVSYTHLVVNTAATSYKLSPEADVFVNTLAIVIDGV